ncbi:LuxR C-terminal-related transcriptional regulator [Rhodococcus opacus]|nr:LuxR C-terminal-related transcriptional regulator [Rhodococcus opacus]
MAAAVQSGNGCDIESAAAEFERIGAPSDALTHVLGQRLPKACWRPAAFERVCCRGRSPVGTVRSHVVSRTGGGRPSLSLTSREWEVGSIVAAGLSNRQIADRLFVSVRTVEDISTVSA